MQKNDINLTFQITQEEGHYSALCLELDISSFGATYEEAVEMLDDAVKSFLNTASLQERAARIRRHASGKV